MDDGSGGESGAQVLTPEQRRADIVERLYRALDQNIMAALGLGALRNGVAKAE